MDFGMNRSRGIRTTRRIVLTKPHLTERGPDDQLVVWRHRRRTYGVSAVLWLVLAAAGIFGAWGATFVALALTTGTVSALVVIKAQVLVSRAEQLPPTP